MTLPRPRCAVTARERGDQLFGTAAPGQRWLLVEHPGPWPRRAFDTSAALLAVAARAVGEGVRAVLIRRPGRPAARSASRAWAYVDVRPGAEGIWWSEYTDERDLLGARLGPGGTRSTEPVQLICAHGKHDTCCAVEGRPVAAALAAASPGTTWECSHVGGDRFAPNVVLLPHGLYYGNLDPAGALRVVDAYRAGAVVPELLRGRSAFPPVVQAAQHYARAHTGETGVDALAPLDVETRGDQTTRVRLTHGVSALTVVVRAGWSDPQWRTCAAGHPEAARLFALVTLG
jgi:(2Fe-2S) ferredoxin